MPKIAQPIDPGNLVIFVKVDRKSSQLWDNFVVSDINIFHRFVRSIIAVNNSDTIYFPDKAFKKLYDLESNLRIYKIDKRLLIHAYGGDGSASYDVLWMIENDNYVGMRILYPP